MSSMRLTDADDMLLHQVARPFTEVVDTAPEWFDRFYFNLHPPGPGPMIVLGGGTYPNRGVVDGFVCVAVGDYQRSLRFSRARTGNRLETSIGPLRWTVLEPLNKWRLEVDGSSEGFSLDVVFSGRTGPYAVQPITVDHPSGAATDFSHFFQAGTYTGELVLDGERTAIDGWIGLRDRSWGVRRTREQLGMHIWIGAHLPDRTIALNYNEDRQGLPKHFDGAILPVDRSLPVLEIDACRHDLRLDEGGELLSGEVSLRTVDGKWTDLSVEALSRGVYMANAGYGGWHGVHRGEMHDEHDRVPLDGSVSPRDLSLGLVDKLCSYTCGDQQGNGVFELAMTRSKSYTYRPTLLGPGSRQESGR